MDLKDVRKNIDFLDSRLLRILNERMELALMARKFKADIEDSDREKTVLERIRQNSPGLINSEFIEKLYTEIIRESKALQKKDFRLIGFKGEHGAYDEIALREWDSDLIPIPCEGYHQVFEDVRAGLYDYGIVPVENTLGGVVGEVNELLVNTDLYVVGAVELPISLCLLVLHGADHREIRNVYSCSQALDQCSNFLSRNNLTSVQYYDSAGAAKMLAEQIPQGTAVIASKLAAEVYDLNVIKEDIDNFGDNITRFLILSREENRDDGDKCSIVFSTEHKAGTLFRALEVFAKKNINLTRIGSIRSGMGDYSFFMDFIGAGRDEKVAAALREVEDVTVNYRFLGCYREKKISQ
ncbi:MAG: chorismate mutase [Deltaproteobacteria bacterium]|nr:chorismate mutase [Deltaproteobacteria bacterium]